MNHQSYEPEFDQRFHGQGVGASNLPEQILSEPHGMAEPFIVTLIHKREVHILFLTRVFPLYSANWAANLPLWFTQKHLRMVILHSFL